MVSVRYAWAVVFCVEDTVVIRIGTCVTSSIIVEVFLSCVRVQGAVVFCVEDTVVIVVLVTFIADFISIFVVLIRVRVIRTIVHVIVNRVGVSITFAKVTYTVTVLIVLIGIREKGAVVSVVVYTVTIKIVVAVITHSVIVQIILVIDLVRTVVLAVGNLVAIDIAVAGVAFAVPVEIELIGVRQVGAVVFRNENSIPVGIKTTNREPSAFVRRRLIKGAPGHTPSEQKNPLCVFAKLHGELPCNMNANQRAHSIRTVTSARSA